MSKVKADYSKTFIENGEEVTIRVAFDVADDSEGYGVVIGDDYTDSTIAFGQGELALSMAHLLYYSVINELESPGMTVDKLKCFDLETVYDFETGKVVDDEYSFKDFRTIVDYINDWIH